MVLFEHISLDEAKRYRSEIRPVVDAIRNHRVPKIDAVAWPAGLDRKLLELLPLKVRTRNCLAQAQLMEGKNRLTVSKLLLIENFGIGTLRDLLCAADDFLKSCIASGGAESPQKIGEIALSWGGKVSFPLELGTVEEDLPDILELSASIIRNPQVGNPSKALVQLLTATAELYGAKTLADALSPQCKRLAFKLGVTSELQNVKIRRMAEIKPGPISVIAARLGRVSTI